MNIALGAFVITILLLPGAFILKAYYTSFTEKDKELYVPFAELLFSGLVFSFLAHFIAIFGMNLFGIQVDYDLLYRTTTGDKFSLANKDFTQSFFQFTAYNLFLLTAVTIITKLLKGWFVRKNYDLLYHGLRTANFWFYTFSARTLQQSRAGEYAKTDLLYVDILSKKDIVYSGFLYDFEYSASKDKMEAITLRSATKRTYLKKEGKASSKDEVSDDLEDKHVLKHAEPRLINGDSFIILWEDVVNINIYYIHWRREAVS